MALQQNQTFTRLDEQLRNMPPLPQLPTQLDMMEATAAMREELDGRFMPNIGDELLRLRWSVFVLQWPLLSWAAIVGRE